ncbi:hypothetical protein BROUX41_005111 [Berkeleyomyces rouxiae]|uniref:uncharacterized protein n=1 Tax=Berkeleyomyces rouxiae TaxID=2035830 RepID=UPI003B7B6F6A
MGIGAVAEPLIVVTLLFGGAYLNRNTLPNSIPYARGWTSNAQSYRKRSDSLNYDVSGRNGSKSPSGDSERSFSSSSSSTRVLGGVDQSPYRRRHVRMPFVNTTLTTPNTAVYEGRLISRILQKFPFLVEAWYWLLLYWVYQIGRAVTALTLVEGTVNVARKHALTLIHIEQALGIFIERPVQDWFLAHPTLLHWINRTYSFIHIPGTILFLVLLYYFTTASKRRSLANGSTTDILTWAGPGLYESRRRAMALCNLIAFCIFTIWPCMPPRLLSDPTYTGEDAAEAKSFGFVDTVHSTAGESSVWTTNRFCNQYAAMPSLHFGYSLLIGLTVATFPIAGLRASSWKRIAIVVIGLSYPSLILTAIISTANHFVLDAVAGGIVCGIAWNANGILLNLLPMEDYFLSFLRVHKPVNCTDPDTAVQAEYQGLMLQEVV